MKDWLSRTQLRQRPMLAVYGGLLVLIAVVIAVMVLSWLGSRSDDRLAVISNLLSFGTLLLALVAGIVALAAYSAATGLPNLKLRFVLQEENPNTAKFDIASVGTEQEFWMLIPPWIASIIVRNSSAYAARSPAVIIEFEGTSIAQERWSDGPNWIATVRNRETGDISAVQWDGGPNYAIHGNSARHLPDLNLQGIRIPDLAAKMTIRVLADGYNRSEITLPVIFAPEEEGPGLTSSEWL